jgi:hypothetical protein
MIKLMCFIFPIVFFSACNEIHTRQLWINNGNWIVFSCTYYRLDDPVGRDYVVELHSGVLNKIFDSKGWTADVSSPRWSPSGHQIAFITNRFGYEIHVTQMTGTNRIVFKEVDLGLIEALTLEWVSEQEIIIATKQATSTAVLIKKINIDSGEVELLYSFDEADFRYEIDIRLNHLNDHLIIDVGERVISLDLKTKSILDIVNFEYDRRMFTAIEIQGENLIILNVGINNQKLYMFSLSDYSMISKKPVNNLYHDFLINVGIGYYDYDEVLLSKSELTPNKVQSSLYTLSSNSQQDLLAVVDDCYAQNQSWHIFG